MHVVCAMVLKPRFKIDAVIMIICSIVIIINSVLTLIPPSGGLYGSQILLFKVLEVQMCY